MEEKIDIELLEKNKEILQEYLRSVTTNSSVCVIQHRAKVKRGDSNALLVQNIMDQFGLTLAEMYFLIVKKNLEDLHIYCEVCGKRAPKLINDKRFCSVKCMHQSEDYQRAIKEGLEARKKEIEKIKKSILTDIKKETEEFSFSDMKARSKELGNYFLSLSKTPGLINISPHRKALVEKNPTAIFVEQMMYKYDLSLDELYLLFKSNFTKSIFCRTCGKRLKHIGKDHCSLRCSKLDPEVQAKFEATSIERYGVANPAKSDDIQERIKKTNLERYGVEHTWQSEEVKSKIRHTLMENYSVTNPNHIPEVRKKIMQTTKAKKYKFFLELLESLRLELVDPYEDFILNDEITIRCKECGTEYKTIFSSSNQLIERCPNCVKPYSSFAEGEILSFVKELLGNSTKILTRDKSMIHPYELDIYIPEYHLAIEYDGTYWHSTNFRHVDENYHKNKTDLCEAKGIRLLHVFEYEWKRNPSIIKSIIRSALRKNTLIIYARKCEVRQLDENTYRDFLILNHIQGYVPTKIKLGLFYENELVACIGIGKSRFKKDETELIRFCVKQNVSVVGGLSKLIKHSGVSDLVSYVNRRYFDGNGYTSAGFEYIGRSSPAYRYVRGDEVVSRVGAQKHRLPKLLGDKFDPEKTEEENMMLNGYCKIYDSGVLKFRYQKQ